MMPLRTAEFELFQMSSLSKVSFELSGFQMSSLSTAAIDLVYMFTGVCSEDPV